MSDDVVTLLGSETWQPRTSEFASLPLANSVPEALAVAGSAQAAESVTNADTGEVIPPCVTRAYTFDANGRRTAKATTTHEGGDCAAAGTTATVTTRGWDGADRPTTAADDNGAYTYDTFGRQTTMPAADAPDPSRGDVMLGYFDDDQPRSVSQGDTSTVFTLDANGRRSTQTTTDPSGTTRTTRRYTDDSDNPAWAETTTPDGSTSTTRFTESLGGDLSATINDDGGLSLSLANPHGDIVTTVDVPAAQTADTAATSITGWASYDEYGNQNNPAATDAVDGPLGYGWLGAKQRSTTSATAGLTLMGVRYYNAVRGFFTSLDPVPGGNENAYTYPNDPINMFDLDGRWSWRKAAKVAGWASLAVCIAASAGACAVAGAVAFGASFMSNRSDYRSRRISRGTFWRRTAVDAALSFVPTGRSLRLVGRHSAGPVARGFRGTAGAMWRGVRNRGTYSGKHRGGFSVRAGLRHSFNEFRRNWKVRPWRSARRVGYGIGAFYAGNRWG